MWLLVRNLTQKTFLPGLLLFFPAYALLSCAALDTFSISKLKPDEFPSHIDKYEAELKTDIGKERRAELLLRLTDLYSCHANPKPDYKKAYAYMNLHIQTFKSGTPSHAALDKLNMLRLIVKGQENNAELNESIKRLEGIDKKIEEIKGK